MQEAAHFTLGPFAITRIGFLKGVRIQSDRGVKFIFVQRDLREKLRHPLPRGDAPLLLGRPHLRDGGFDHPERLLCSAFTLPAVTLPMERGRAAIRQRAAHDFITLSVHCGIWVLHAGIRMR